MSEVAATVKVMEYPPHLKHKTIFETFAGLESGQFMMIINDHDPVPLHYQFQSMHGDGFTWEYIERGPDLFRIQIGKK